MGSWFLIFKKKTLERRNKAEQKNKWPREKSEGERKWRDKLLRSCLKDETEGLINWTTSLG